MPIRTSGATAQSLSHIWISDDILAEAFDRFVRVSHAHTCRRYGSNVPGPLEARRRHAKRRMGIAAHTAPGNTGPVDFGALFGLGPPRTDWEKEWTWQPPSHSYPLVGVKPPPPVPTAVWSALAGLSKQRPGQNEQDKVLQTAQQSSNPIGTSRHAFKQLWTNRTKGKIMDAVDLNPMLDFLQSSADEPKASNFLRLANWLSDQSLTSDALQSTLEVLRNKLQLQAAPGNVTTAEILSRLLRHQGAGQVATYFTQTLDALPDTSVRKIVTHVTRDLETHASEVPSAAWRDLACLWLRILNPCVHTQGDHAQSYVWSFVYHELAARLTVPDLAEHLATLKRLDLARVLLRHWAPKYMHNESTTEQKAYISMSANQYNLQVSQAEGSGSLEALVNAFEGRIKERLVMADQNESAEYEMSLTDMVVVLKDHHVPYAHLVNDIFSVYTATKHPLTVWRLFRDLFTRQKLAIGEETAVDIIHFLLETGNQKDLQRAYWIFDRVKTIPATQCPDLAIRLIQNGMGTPERIFAMINRRTFHDTVPIDQRTVSTLAIKNAHSDLVELVAYTYAKSLWMSNRVAFRRVWECFRYLQDRGAPMSSLMSRAMVRAGIARGMQYDNRYVARQQIRYILSVVGRIEGEQAAVKLDRLIFGIKRTRNFDPDGADMMAREMRRARVAEKNLANQVRWRLRRWTRRQSSPWFSMRGVESGSQQLQGHDKGLSETSEQWTTLQRSAVEAETAQKDVGRNLEEDDSRMASLREEIDTIVRYEAVDETPNARILADEDLDNGLASVGHGDHLPDISGTTLMSTEPSLTTTTRTLSCPARATVKPRLMESNETIAFRPFPSTVAGRMAVSDAV